MKKVGIITITDNNNYGNRLQNYATEYILKKLNMEPSTIWGENERYNFKRKIKLMIKKYIPFDTHFKRAYNFETFTRKYTNITYASYSKKLEEIFDYIIVGSDQIFRFQLEKIECLSEIDKNKIIAFAPSFGVNTIKDKDIDWYKKIISNIKYLSVREDAGKKIIEDLSKRNDAQVLLDPTMLLTSNEWDKIACKPKMLKSKKYILNYFLGELSESRKKEIEKIAKENQCEVINIMDQKSPYYSCGPSEFLYLEKNAFLICTDSFHSSVFAIIYNNPFLVFEREQQGAPNMNSRLDTLLSKFELEDRRFKGKIQEQDLKCDYKIAYQILEKEREKSNKFLKEALDIKE